MATNWLDQLLPASFKGVRFHVDTIDWTAGDNIVIREYPFQDKPTVFRMGAAVQTIKFSAYLIGDDYTQQRDRLAQALSGDGDLVHPTAGTMRAFVGDKFTFREAPTEEGGVARVDLTFVLAEPRRYPTGISSSTAVAQDAAAQAKAASVDAFASSFDLSQAPGWVFDTMLAGIMATMSKVVGPLQAATRSEAEFTSQAIAKYQLFRDTAKELIDTPRVLATSIAELFSLPTDMSAATARLFSIAAESAFAGPLAEDDGTVLLPNSSVIVMMGVGAAEAVAQGSDGRLYSAMEAFQRLIQSLAIAAQVDAQVALAEAEPDAVDVAETQRLRTLFYRRITEMLSSASDLTLPAILTADASQQPWHDAMLRLLSAAVAELRARPGAGRRLDTYTPNGWEPVWQVSYRLYGTASFADEILAMNPQITNPLLVPPGKPLTVVRHG